MHEIAIQWHNLVSSHNMINDHGYFVDISISGHATVAKVTRYPEHPVCVFLNTWMFFEICRLGPG
jgi:hypothetical protein